MFSLFPLRPYSGVGYLVDFIKLEQYLKRFVHFRKLIFQISTRGHLCIFIIGKLVILGNDLRKKLVFPKFLPASVAEEMPWLRD